MRFCFDEKPETECDNLKRAKIKGTDVWVGSPNSQATVLAYLFPDMLADELDNVGDFDDLSALNDDHPVVYEERPGKYVEVNYPVLYQFFTNRQKLKRIDDEYIYASAFDVENMLPDQWLDECDEYDAESIGDDNDESDIDYTIVIKETESRKFGDVNESLRHRKFNEAEEMDKNFGNTKVFTIGDEFFCRFNVPSRLMGKMNIEQMEKQIADFDEAMKNNKAALKYMIANEKKLQKL